MYKYCAYSYVPTVSQELTTKSYKVSASPIFLIHSKWTHISSNIHRWREISNFEKFRQVFAVKTVMNLIYYTLKWGESFTGNAADKDIFKYLLLYGLNTSLHSSITVMAWWVTKQSPIFFQYWFKYFSVSDKANGILTLRAT